MSRALAAIRTYKNLNQTQLAKLADLDQRAISQIECGWTPPLEIQQQLAQALNMPLEDLFPGEHRQHELLTALKRAQEILRRNNIDRADIDAAIAHAEAL